MSLISGILREGIYGLLTFLLNLSRVLSTDLSSSSKYLSSAKLLEFSLFELVFWSILIEWFPRDSLNNFEIFSGLKLWDFWWVAYLIAFLLAKFLLGPVSLFSKTFSAEFLITRWGVGYLIVPAWAVFPLPVCLWRIFRYIAPKFDFALGSSDVNSRELNSENLLAYVA